MRMMVRIATATLLLVSMLLLGGCITETNGKKTKEVDQTEVLRKLTELGIGYLRQGDYARAKDNLRKAAEVDPKSPLVQTTFGLVFQLEGEDKLAEHHHRLAIKYGPKFSPARNNYGAFLFAQGRYDEAIVQLRVAAQDRFYPRRAQVFENLGVCYLRIGESVKAEDSFVRAVELHFSQGRALLELSIIRYEQQDFMESKRLYDRHASVVQQSSRSLGICIKLARVFDDDDSEASCALVLKNIFPASSEYEEYQQTI
jgi:type IV pilus assembly protein PilF